MLFPSSGFYSNPDDRTWCWRRDLGSLSSLSHTIPSNVEQTFFKTYRSCVELLYLKCFLVPYWSGLEWGQLQFLAIPWLVYGDAVANPVFAWGLSLYPALPGNPIIWMITYISIAFCLPFLKLVPTRKEVQIPTQHVVTKTSERMREENVDGRKCMLLLYSKILCIYKHLMKAYFEKVFKKFKCFKKLQLDTQIVLSSPSPTCR